MEYYPFTAGTDGKPYRQVAQGAYIRYYSVSAGADAPAIIVETDSKKQLLLLPGQDVTLSVNVNEWRIRNKDRTVAITGIIIIADRDERVTDGRVSGTVSVIDGGKDATLSGAAFFKKGSQAAVAAQYSHVQLLNPLGSGVRAIIENILPSAAAGSGSFGVRRYDTQLASLDGLGINKNTGGAAAKCGVYVDSNVALLGTGTAMQNFAVAPITSPPLKLATPVIIYPGQGYVVVWDVVNNTIATTYEWKEEAWS